MTHAWFVSDIHIKTLNERNSITLLRFLDSLVRSERKATHLFLVGDIFDLWVGSSEVFYTQFKPIVDALAALQKQGVEVHYFEGNHDMHVKQFWSSFGVSVWVDEKYFQLGPHLVRVEHGDFINPDDTTYLRYREIIRSKGIESLAQKIPGAWIQAIGNFASKRSRKYSGQRRISYESKFREMIRTYAEKCFAAAEYNYLITGHMHIRDEYILPGKLCKGLPVCSLNLGSWFEEPQVLEITDAGHEWHTLVK